jgi:hypothetical protein
MINIVNNMLTTIIVAGVSLFIGTVFLIWVTVIAKRIL